MTTAPLIELSGISKSYGPIQALKTIDFSARPGSVHAILGENGAGKSTLMKLLSGAIQPTTGEIRLEGRPIRFSGTRQASAAGIVCMFQELSLLPTLSVGDNITLARPQTQFGFMLAKAYEEARAALDLIGAESISLDTPVEELSLADRQRVEIAKALYQKPRLLILDEATSALGASAVEKVFTVIRKLRDEGCCILFISHRFHEVEALADTISVFRAGQHVRTFPSGTIDNQSIVSLMIGETMDRLFPPPRPALPANVAPLLSIKDLCFAGELFNVGFTVRPGEIYGLGGLEGQGQQRVLEAIFGTLSGVSGSIELSGKTYERRSPHRSKSPEIGLALVPEDRKTEGMIQPLSISDNMRLAGIGLHGDSEALDARCLSLLERLELTYGQLSDPVMSLSGGNQQKVLLAKWLALGPRCLLLLDPTRGIDVKTKAQIYRLLNDLAGQGIAIVMQSTDYEELVHLCDRVAVFYRGRIARELSGDTLTPENLISAAMGLSTSTPAPETVQ
ncbi:sugar ABC transporter ATP-binding protein [Rhizobium sp. G187]|uniref:sugar ABC transporter ATP-binding protein n=1 Tax=Rhizobium sp. G187 TaxID=3451352 RepID=UPI003EE49A6E